MPRRKPRIDRNNNDLEEDEISQLPSKDTSLYSKLFTPRPSQFTLQDADAALYGSRGPETSPEKKAFNTLQKLARHDASSWTPDDKNALMEQISLLRRWLDDLEEKAK